MTEGERFRKVEELYHHAAELPPHSRGLFLEDACGEDRNLRSEVESLLAFEHESERFLASPALAVATPASLEGQQLGSYQLISRLGAGGMGEVYLAEDIRLGRRVAVKVLPPGLSLDAVRRRRFAQEARAASALNHPNIVTVHDVGCEEGLDFIVMEYVQGDTLEQRLRAGAIGFDEARRLASQIADALSQAHRAGIVHRDLKPGNIMLTPEAGVKVLDFGLAKVGLAAPAQAHVSAETTIVGTVAYMSPEQAKGHAVDARSDIFSFGAVLYEMLTGERAFSGDSTASTMAAVLTGEPKPLRDYTAAVPAGIEPVLARCMAKDPARRWQSMADVQAALEHVALRQPRRWLPFVAVAALALLAGATVWQAGVAGNNREAAITDYPGEELYPSLSPDGRQVAFCWNREGAADIYVRPVGGEAPPVRLTNHSAGQCYPRWSPDGKWIAYTYGAWIGMAQGFNLNIIPANGGFARELAETGARTLDWTPDSKWIIATGRRQPGTNHRGLVRVSAETGRVEAIPYALPQTTAGGMDSYGVVSPDGKRIAFERNDVYVVPIDGGTPRQLTFRKRYVSGLDWAPGGREIVFHSRENDYAGLFRVPVDAGDQPPVTRVRGAGEWGQYPVFARAVWNGRPRLVYSRARRGQDIARLDFSAGSTAAGAFRILLPATEREQSPAISPDGSRIAFVSARTGAPELYVSDSQGQQVTRLTQLNAAQLRSPAWSPDGSEILFTASWPNTGGVYRISSRGGPARPVHAGGPLGSDGRFSRDGRWIYFQSGQQPGFWRVPASAPAPERTEWRRVTGPGPIQGFPSPNGKQFFCSYKDRPGIFAVPAEGGTERVVLQRTVGRLWTVAGRYVYYFDQEGVPVRSTVPKPLRRLDPETGEEVLVGPVAAAVHEGLSDAFSVSPDGRFILFVYLKQVADLMLVDNFR